MRDSLGVRCLLLDLLQWLSLEEGIYEGCRDRDGCNDLQLAQIDGANEHLTVEGRDKDDADGGTDLLPKSVKVLDFVVSRIESVLGEEQNKFSVEHILIFATALKGDL